MTQVWKVAPGVGAEDWDVFRKTGCIGVGWTRLNDYRRFETEGEILLALKKAYKEKEGNRKGAARAIYQFGQVIKPSNVVIANMGLSVVKGIGLITSGYLRPKSKKNPIRSDARVWRRHVRRVEWLITQELDIGEMVFSQSAVHRVSTDQCSRIRKAYLSEHPNLSKTLERLFCEADANTTNLTAPKDLDLLDLFSSEGRKTLVQHLKAEGKPKLIAAKKAKVLAAGGKLVCEVCEFDFEQQFGELGKDFCEVHHRKPLGHGKTLKDLAILCSNCHRMIHRTDPIMAVDKFREGYLSQLWH